MPIKTISISVLGVSKTYNNHSYVDPGADQNHNLIGVTDQGNMVVIRETSGHKLQDFLDDQRDPADRHRSILERKLTISGLDLSPTHPYTYHLTAASRLVEEKPIHNYQAR